MDSDTNGLMVVRSGIVLLGVRLRRVESPSTQRCFACVVIEEPR